MAATDDVEDDSELFSSSLDLFDFDVFSVLVDSLDEWLPTIYPPSPTTATANTAITIIFFFYQKSSVSMHLASFYDAAIGHQALLK